MKISFVPIFEDWALSPGIHILTFAEEGFAPLNFHAKQFQIDKSSLVKFADAVNARDESGSLYPIAPISAIPRRIIREDRGFVELPRFLEEFNQVNSRLFSARKVIMDFVTNQLSTGVLKAMEATLPKLPESCVEEFVIVR